MKRLLLLLFISIFSASLYAQVSDTAWKKGGKMSLTFTQVSFSNWAAGGENSYGGSGFLNLFANYKEGKRIWDNDLDLNYGMIKLDDKPVRKSEDKIDFLSKYGHQIAKNLYASANINFLTQFTEGFKYPNDSTVVSSFMAPGYLQFGLGIDYKPTSYFSVSFLPLTGRITYVHNQSLADSGAYGVTKAVLDVDGNVITPGKNSRAEFGMASFIIFQKEVLKNIEFKSKLSLFSSYLDHPENIDINWDALLSLKVNKYISTYIGLSMIYDDDIILTDKDGKQGPRTQYKQMFGVGLALDI